MTTPLTALATIITSNVQTLEAAYAQAGSTFPSLDDPFSPEPLDSDPSLKEMKKLIVAAAAQILATVRSPPETLMEYSPSTYLTMTLGFVVDTNIPDILKGAGPQGLHVEKISAQSGLDPSYLARVLRFLATRHVFREITPNVFANNRISSLLTKAKTIGEIKSDPLAQFEGAPLAALASMSGDEVLKTSAHLSDYIQNPDRSTLAFNMGLATDSNMWNWYEEPGNEWRAQRFAVVMKGAAENRFPPDTFTNAIGGLNLKNDDLIVDVGGNIGAVTHILYEAFQNLRYVVQDLEKPLVFAKRFWDEKAPGALTSGRVTLQEHDFFTPQPVKGAAVYFTRLVFHDWADHDAKKILKHLRDAANDNSKAIIFDSVAVHVCADPSTDASDAARVPYPLLGNLGIAGAGFETAADLQMMGFFNGKERTEEEFRELGRSTGWKLEKVVRGILPTFIFSAV